MVAQTEVKDIQSFMQPYAKQKTTDIAEAALQMGIEETPVIGDIAQIYQIFKGEEVVTGQKLGPIQRALMAATAVIPFAPSIIKAAAIRLKSGKIFTGKSHHEAMEAFDEAGYTLTDWHNKVDDADGFVTNKNEFVTRAEAVKLTGQKSEDAADIVGLSLTEKAYKLAETVPKAQLIQNQQKAAKLSNELLKEGKFQEAMDAASDHQMWREAVEKLEGQKQHK